ncbi:MAG: radical SAM protein [Spirochaetales bacterium]|nr:radical SAM protein [Spirochaetales bacterium]
MTNWKTSFSHLVKHVFVQRSASGLRAVEAARGYLNDIKFRLVEDETEIPEEYLKGTTLYLCRHKGNPVGECPGSKGHICCNYHTVDLYTGCSLGCTYCIMRSYLNFSPVSVFVDPGPSIEHIRETALQNPEKKLRVGTGETGDSLLFDPIFQLSAEFIEAFSEIPNIYFEMKTKTDLVEHLFDIPAKGNGVVGFSLNPEEIGKSEEGISSPVKNRLDASLRAVHSGYLTSFHFDPVFKRPDWRELYFPLIDRLKTIPRARIAWISLGTFRYPPQLKDRIAKRPYLYDEFVPSKDGKYRYIQRSRVRIYRELVERIKSVTGAPVYLCMESEAVWKRVFGGLPNEIADLNGIFDIDLPRR